MMTCLVNDCTGFRTPAPCCLYCSERERCPDRCHKTDNTNCGRINNDDCKGISEKNNKDPQRD